LNCHFPDWKIRSNWDAAFQDSNRNYVNISNGVEYEIIMPFNEIKVLDTDMNQGADLIQLLKSILDILKSKMSY
jgi:hypothetical protein